MAQVSLYGGGVRQFQVLVDPDYLIAHNLTITDILDATRQATGVRGAGFQESQGQRLVLRVEARVRTAEELGAAVITVSAGTPIRLRDVGRVVEGPEPKFGDAAINGVPGVTMVIFKQYGGDTLAITQTVEAEIDRLRPGLEREGITYHPALFRQADFIRAAVGNVTQSLLIGAALVGVVLFVFLFNFRTAVISLTAIPLSLLGAVSILWAFGVSLNTLTLGGLAIAVGEVVDDAVIDVENIYRRLWENARVGYPRAPAEVVLAASLEVRGSVVYATLIVVLVFVPVFFMTGLQGRLFSPLGYAYALAVLASLAVALTVTPSLAMILLPHAKGATEPPLLRGLQHVYQWLICRLDRLFPQLVAVVLILLAGAGWAASRFGGEFMPELKENHYVIHMRGAPGTSLQQSMAAGEAVTRELLKIPAVVSVSQQAGRAELGEDPCGVEYSELEVQLKPLSAEEGEEVGQAIKSLLRNKFPGFSFEVFSFLSERIEETISGAVTPVAVKVYGDDLDTLDRAARDIARVLATVPGNESVRPEAQAGQPELVVRIRREEAARHDLCAVQILDAVNTAYQGTEAARVYDRNRIVSLVVRLEPSIRNDPSRVAKLWLNTPAGQLQLEQVADVYLSDGRFLIVHEGGIRRQQVTCAVRGRDVESFVADAEKHLQKLSLPPEVTLSVTGEHQTKQAAQRELLALGMVAGTGILLLLWVVLGSVRQLLLVLLNLPFALVGGVAAIHFSGGVLDVGGLVGFVTLFGITVRNGIMMVSHWQHLREAEGMEWGPELIWRGARERLAPVLMTATVTGLGLLPIALGGGSAGGEIEGPMALVILGSLVTSTALNLLVLPLVYRRFGGARPAVQMAH